MFHLSSAIVYYAGALYNKTSSKYDKLFSKVKYWRCYLIKSTISISKLAVFLSILLRTRFFPFKSYSELNHQRSSGQHSRWTIISKSLSKVTLSIVFWYKVTSLFWSGVSQFIRKSVQGQNILKSVEIDFFSICLETDILEKPVSEHSSIFQTHCTFPDSQFSCFYILILIIYSSNVVILCNANFTQKKCKGQCDKCDALLTHPDTVFLSEEKVKKIKRHVL